MKLSIASAIVATLTCASAAFVSPAKPREADSATIARALKQRQTNRRDITRRAIENAGMVKRQAAPSVGLGG